MKPILLAGAFACVTTAIALSATPEKAAAAPAPAAPKATAATAAETTPEAIAEKIEELLNTEGENPENEKEFAAFWTKQLAMIDGMIADFRAKFPTHPLRWRLLMHEANAREIREELSIPFPKGSKTSAEIYAEIIASPDADPMLKAEASSARLIGSSDQVATKKVALADWESQLAAHMKAFPDSQDNMVLVEMRLMLVEEHANARYIPLLEELS
jgi:hypothetical protein